MTEKLKAYLDGLFAVAPMTDDMKDVRDELYAGMVERYNDCLAEGMDEQAAYDAVVDSIGDIRELFDELDRNRNADAGSWAKREAAGEAPPHYAESKPGGFSFNLSDMIRKVTDFTGGLVDGLFTSPETGEVRLVNEIRIALDNIWRIDIGYVPEAIKLFASDTGELVVKEYMNQEDPTLFATATIAEGGVQVRHGRRNGVFHLRSHIEVFLPPDWAGNLTLSTVSGSIKSEEVWRLSSFTAKTVSGSLQFAEIYAPTIRLGSTSGSVQLAKAAGQLQLSSVSGSIKALDVEGHGSFKSTSGGVRALFSRVDGDVEASTISGGIRLGIPEGTAFEFDARTVSGSIHTAFEDQLTFTRRNKAHGFIGKAPFYKVSASTTSGGVHVND